MISFIFRTDVHAADKNPVSWKGSYRDEILSSLAQIGDLAREHKVAAVLDAGDFFHVPVPGRTSHGLVNSVVRVHREHYDPIPVFSIEGNHDILGKNLNSIEGQPLGVLFSTEVFKPLRDQTFEQDGLRVRVVGLPYCATRTVQDIQEIRKGSEDYLVVLIHALAGENPPDHVEEFYGEPVFRYSSLVYENGPDVFCFGHWHKDQGIVSLDGRYFVNQGAVSRGSLSKDNLTRVPQVSLLEFRPEGIRAVTLSLKVDAADEVFDVERKERQERETIAISQFIDQLQQGSVTDTEDIESSIRQASVAQEVQLRALSYLETARST